MSTILGRHLEELSTSTNARHFQVFSIDIDIFWSQSLISCTCSRGNAWKVSLFVGVGVRVCMYIYIYINAWFCIWSTYDSGFFGLFSRDKSIYFRHLHRNLQGTLSTFDIDICRHLNQHLCNPLGLVRPGSHQAPKYFVCVRAYTSTHPPTTLKPAKIEKYTRQNPYLYPCQNIASLASNTRYPWTSWRTPLLIPHHACMLLLKKHLLYTRM